MGFDKIFDLTAAFFFFLITYFDEAFDLTAGVCFNFCNISAKSVLESGTESLARTALTRGSQKGTMIVNVLSCRMCIIVVPQLWSRFPYYYRVMRIPHTFHLICRLYPCRCCVRIPLTFPVLQTTPYIPQRFVLSRNREKACERTYLTSGKYAPPPSPLPRSNVNRELHRPIRSGPNDCRSPAS